MNEEQWEKQRCEEEQAVIESNAELIEDFCQLAISAGIDSQSIHFTYSAPCGLMACYPGILRALTPDLKVDKDGLYSVDEIVQHFPIRTEAPGYFYNDSFASCFVRFFRRGFCPSCNWAPHFIEKFWQSHIDSATKCTILLDEDRVRIDREMAYFEFDTWFGPPFDGAIEEIRDGNAKLASPPDVLDDHLEFFFKGVESWDLKWSTRGNLKSFQAMEFKSLRAHTSNIVKFNGHYPVRYFHSQFDIEKRCFVHIDGAILFMKAEDYSLRKQSDFNYQIKHGHHHKADHTKIFKINGATSVGQWKELLSHFFHGNVLVYEYLCGQAD